MSKFCPITGGKVVYLTCQECEDKVCEKQKVMILGKKMKTETVGEAAKNSNTDVEKAKPIRGNCDACETCCHMTSQKNEKFFGKEMLVTYCEVYRNHLIDSAKVSREGCEYHNRDMSDEKICMNCELYLGGGDWGLSCGAEYHKLTTALSPACESFKKKERQ